jgi:hypothetical protein
VDFSFRHLQPGSILELGGGNGAYSLALQNAGRPATVADINPLHLEVARSAGLETLLVDPDQIFPDSSWDNVLMIEVLEHVQDPKDFLAKACRIARKRVIFTIPCSSDFHELFHLGLTYNHIAVTDHLHHFDEIALQELIAPWKDRSVVELGDFIVHQVLFELVWRSVKGRLARWTCLRLLRTVRRLGRIPPRYPTRYMVCIRLGDSHPAPITDIRADSIPAYRSRSS